MKKCEKKLKELIQNVIIPDIEDYLDDLFEEIASNKNATDDNNQELQNMHEMKDEFLKVLQDIENNELDNEECVELLEEITQMIE